MEGSCQPFGLDLAGERRRPEPALAKVKEGDRRVSKGADRVIRSSRAWYSISRGVMLLNTNYIISLVAESPLCVR